MDTAGRWKLCKVLMLLGCSLVLLLLPAAPAFAGNMPHGYAVMWDGGQQIVLGSLGGLNSRALDINRAGAVVGWADTALGGKPDVHAFLWQNGVMTDLGTLGGPDSCAYSINDRGKVAGVAQDEDGEWHAVIWYQGSVTDLGVIGPNGLYPMDADYSFIPRVLGSSSTPYQKNYLINARGSVAGDLDSIPDNLLAWHAFFWAGGLFHDIGTLGANPWSVNGSFAAALNNLGRVVGYSSFPGADPPLDPPYGGFRAFSWTSSGGLQSLPPLKGYSFSEAWAVNDLGLVAGVSYSILSSAGSVSGAAGDAAGPTFGDSPGRATVWRGASPLSLGTLGGTFSKAVGINSRNDVIGVSTTKVLEEQHAFLKAVSILDFFKGLGWLPLKPMQDLGTLGGLTSYPNDLNYSRQVVGFSKAPIANPTAASFVDHAFLWQGGVMTDLAPDDGLSEATAINAGGQVVGYLYPHVDK